MRIKNTLLALFMLISAGAPLVAASLSIDTEYRLRGISFANNDFDATTSTDAVNYYSQNLKLSVKGNFAPGVEIAASLSALGVAGSTYTILDVPAYPATNFTPFVDSAYLKISNLGDAPIDIYAGKQNLQYGDGFIIGNNGNGFMALRLLGRLEKPIPWEAEVFTAKISEAYKPDSDHDIYGAVAGLTWSKLLWEAGYFEDRDFSGSKYRQGLLEADTRDIVKQYYDFRVGRREKFANYHVEIAKQQGYILKPDRTKVALDGLGYILQGELVGENTKLGKVVARALFQCSTGDDNTLSLDDTDESFTPTLMRRSDGLEKFGYGELCAATPMGMFFEVPENYSGINTLSVGAAFSPLYAWTFDVTYYLYSASQGPRG